MPVDPKDFSSYLLRTRRPLKRDFVRVLRETGTPQSVAYNAFSAWFVALGRPERQAFLTKMIGFLSPEDLDVGDSDSPDAPGSMKIGTGAPKPPKPNLSGGSKQAQGLAASGRAGKSKGSKGEGKK